MNVEDAERRLDNAEAKFKQAVRITGREANQDPSSVLTLSQRCIEHCAKAIFILMGVNEPTSHSIPVDSEEANQLLNAVHDELDEEYTKKSARLIFITELYGNTYPVSEYGVNIAQTRMEANDILDRMEGDQAYNHADAIVKLTREILDESRIRTGMTEKRREDLVRSAFEPT